VPVRLPTRGEVHAAQPKADVAQPEAEGAKLQAEEAAPQTSAEGRAAADAELCAASLREADVAQPKAEVAKLQAEEAAPQGRAAADAELCAASPRCGNGGDADIRPPRHSLGSSSSCAGTCSRGRARSRSSWRFEDGRWKQEREKGSESVSPRGGDSSAAEAAGAGGADAGAGSSQVPAVAPPCLDAAAGPVAPLVSAEAAVALRQAVKRWQPGLGHRNNSHALEPGSKVLPTEFAEQNLLPVRIDGNGDAASVQANIMAADRRRLLEEWDITMGALKVAAATASPRLVAVPIVSGGGDSDAGAGGSDAGAGDSLAVAGSVVAVAPARNVAAGEGETIFQLDGLKRQLQEAEEKERLLSAQNAQLRSAAFQRQRVVHCT